VTASASGGTNNYGVYNTSSYPTSSSPTITSLTATASGGTKDYGVWNSSSSPTIQDSFISASGGGTTNDGIHNDASSGSYTVKINNSQIYGINSTIYQVSYYTTKVGASQLIGGGAQPSDGNYTCVASYNGDYAALSNICH
jgi:hypothetical protein